MSICAECAMLGLTCCSVKRDILVTLGDIDRIARLTGQTDFFEYRCPIDPAYLDQAHDPNWLRYTVYTDGTRRVLKRAADGACVFVNSTGCVLPMDVRPLVCRLYPFNYTEEGLAGVVTECPEYLLTHNETILDALHMSYTAAYPWWDALYTELRSEERKAS